MNSSDSRSPDAPSGETREPPRVHPEDFWSRVWHDAPCRGIMRAHRKATDPYFRLDDGSKLTLYECLMCGARIFAGLDAKRYVRAVWADDAAQQLVSSSAPSGETDEIQHDVISHPVSAPSAEGMPESEVERDARDRLNRYSGGVRSWDGWPKNELASRRMDLRIVLNRLAKAEAEISRLTREKDEAVQAEREACARLVEGAHERWVQLRETTCDLIAEEIRARASSPPGATT